MVRLIVSDVPVLAVGEKKGQAPTNVSLRVDDRTAAKFAFASDNGKVWLALRPVRAPSRPGRPSLPLRRCSSASRPFQCARHSVAVHECQRLQRLRGLEGSLGLEEIQEALPIGVRRCARSRSRKQGAPADEILQGADLVIVGCSQSHDQALGVITAATATAAGPARGRPLPRVAERLSRAGLRGGRRRSHRAPAVGGPARVCAREGAGAAARAGSQCGRRGDDHGARARRAAPARQSPSSNLVVALALEGKSTVLVDLDLQFGDVGLALGLEPTRTIYDLAVSGGSLDVEKLEGFLAEHPSGARALLAPLRPDQAAAVGTAVPTRGVRALALALRLRHRRHAPGIYARGDRGCRRFLASLRRRDARRALAEGHEDRARDAGADGLRPEGGHARAQPCGLNVGITQCGCRAAARACARRACRQRPRDSACSHERPADRGR